MIPVIDMLLLYPPDILNWRKIWAVTSIEEVLKSVRILPLSHHITIISDTMACILIFLQNKIVTTIYPKRNLTL